MDIEENRETALISNRSLQQSNRNVSFSSSDTVLWDNTTSSQRQMIESISEMVNDDETLPNDGMRDESFKEYETVFKDNQFIRVNFKMEICPESNPKEEAVIGLMYSKVAELVK